MIIKKVKSYSIRYKLGFQEDCFFGYPNEIRPYSNNLLDWQDRGPVLIRKHSFC